jgi:hypothetical protein
MLSLKSAFEKGLQAFDVPRGDEEAAHVSDLGKCLFDVWARRNGEPQVVRSAKTRAMLQAGLRDEDWIVDRIQKGLDPAEGWRVAKSGVLAAESDLVGHMDVEIARLRCFKCGNWQNLAGDQWLCFVTGCTSGVISPYDTEGVERKIFDVKTTEFKEQWVETGAYYDSGKPVKTRTRVPWDDAPGDMALLQVYGYAKRRPRNPDGSIMPIMIVQWCRASMQMAEFGWYSEGDRTFSRIARLHEARTQEVIATTKPGSDPVQSQIAYVTASGLLAGYPRENWQCKYCSNAMCALNVNPDNAVIPA